MPQEWKIIQVEFALGITPEMESITSFKRINTYKGAPYKGWTISVGVEGGIPRTFTAKSLNGAMAMFRNYGRLTPRERGQRDQQNRGPIPPPTPGQLPEGLAAH